MRQFHVERMSGLRGSIELVLERHLGRLTSCTSVIDVPQLTIIYARTLSLYWTLSASTFKRPLTQEKARRLVGQYYATVRDEMGGLTYTEVQVVMTGLLSDIVAQYIGESIGDLDGYIAWLVRPKKGLHVTHQDPTPNYFAS